MTVTVMMTRLVITHVVTMAARNTLLIALVTVALRVGLVLNLLAGR